MLATAPTLHATPALHDALVEDTPGLATLQFAVEGETQIGDIGAVGGMPVAGEVHAHGGARPHPARAFLERLAGHRLHQAFTRVEMPGRLVEAQALPGVLLDHQVAAVVLDDRGHGNAWLPEVHFPSLTEGRDITPAGFERGPRRGRKNPC